MFEDLPEGQTHYVGDGCDPPHEPLTKNIEGEKLTNFEYRGWRMLLSPICWIRTRFIWPYPVSGHTYVWFGEWDEGNKHWTALRCEICRHIDFSWKTL